jgi:DNA-binding NarL/FixJ family response regulator
MQSSGQLRILIADDHDIVRGGLRTLLSSQPGWVICAEASTGREAITKAEQHRPDIVIMDLAMPHLNGLEATRRIRKMLPKTEILILTLHYAEQLVRDAVEAGAHAYILKSDAERDLLIAVKALANRGSFFTAGAAQIIIDSALNKDLESKPGRLKHKRLTSREREIVQLVAEGKSSKEVAGMLGLSTKTAETHRANLMRKLELHSVSELVRYAIRNRVIEP